MERRTVQCILMKIEEDLLNKGIERGAVWPWQWRVACSFPLTHKHRHQRQVYSQIFPCNVIPFIQRCHSDGSYYFWPDVASAHYSQQALKVLLEAGIWYIPEDQNRPAVASLCPNGTFRTIDWHPKRPFMTAGEKLSPLMN